jgi:hypothetical protein
MYQHLCEPQGFRLNLGENINLADFYLTSDFHSIRETIKSSSLSMFSLHLIMYKIVLILYCKTTDEWLNKSILLLFIN